MAPPILRPIIFYIIIGAIRAKIKPTSLSKALLPRSVSMKKKLSAAKYAGESLLLFSVGFEILRKKLAVRVKLIKPLVSLLDRAAVVLCEVISQICGQIL